MQHDHPARTGGPWVMTGEATVSNVYLGHERLVECADQLAEGRAFELLLRLRGEDPRLASILHLICAEAEAPGLYGTLFLEHAVDLLCVQLLRSHSTLSTRERRDTGGLAPWQVRKVVAFMKERLGDETSLQDLANVVSMTRFHFCTAFRRATGMAPHEYLTMLRMKRAKELLGSTELAVGDVAEVVGYGSVSSFSTAFRRHAGVSPTGYRRLR